MTFESHSSLALISLVHQKCKLLPHPHLLQQVFPYLPHFTRTDNQIPIAILVHEYVITFVEEVDRMWYPTFHGPRMSWNWASFFFYLNRYLVLFGHGPVIMEFFWTTSNQHDKLQVCGPSYLFSSSGSPIQEIERSFFLTSTDVSPSPELLSVTLTDPRPAAMPSNHTINIWRSSFKSLFPVRCTFNRLRSKNINDMKACL